jgi:predicted transcriptional regulator
MWTSPGDFGRNRGVFTPDWWGSRTQHGVLKTISIDERGSFIDGIQMSAVNLDGIEVEYGKEITFRIVSPENARNPGGVSLFGKGFGNYDQDINIVMEYAAVNTIP